MATLFFYLSNYHKMKKILLIALSAACIISCTKKSTTTPSTPPTPYTKTHERGFITWGKPNRMMYNYWHDSMYFHVIADTSYIKYHGRDYYIWWMQGGKNPETSNYFTDSSTEWYHCFVSPSPFDSTNGSLVTVNNHPYWYYNWVMIDTSGVSLTFQDTFVTKGQINYR